MLSAPSSQELFRAQGCDAGKGKKLHFVSEADFGDCHNRGQVNNILMSSNKESKAIKKKEKIISRVSKLYLIYPESKGVY